MTESNTHNNQNNNNVLPAFIFRISFGITEWG